MGFALPPAAQQPSVQFLNTDFNRPKMETVFFFLQLHAYLAAQTFCSLILEDIESLLT
jgi:hypothetical protein